MYTYRLNVAVIGGLFLFQNISHAQVSTDGTTGESLELDGPDYDIGAELGTEAGDNLFHSFDEFSIDTGESATFSGPGNIENIISRVTGGELSAIDGLIASDISGANLFLFNPAGVVFGANASLDVSGSFHVSTADELRLANGGKFSAVDPESGGFSVAEPESFGFLSADPAGITIEGSGLAVADGETLSVVGGDIDIDGGVLLASDGGQLNLLAADGEAEADLASGNLSGADEGDITVSDASTLAVAGDGGGTIRIEGGAFVVDDGSQILSANDGATDGDVAIKIKAESFELEDGSAIITSAEADGQGGSVDIDADEILVDDSQISSQTIAAGDGGDINIAGDDVTIRNGGFALTVTTDSGNGGSINVDAGNGDLIDGDLVTTTAETASGNGGDIDIEAGELEIRSAGPGQGSIISTGAFGAGDAGDIEIRGGEVVADANGELGGASIQSLSNGSGSAGQIELAVDSLDLIEGGIVSTDVQGTTSNSEGIVVTADEITIDNKGSDDVITGITLTITDDSISTGTIVVRAGDLELIDGGRIQSITTDANDAADISITAENITLDGDPDSQFASSINSSVNPGADGDSGEITIVADDIDMRGSGEISATSAGNGDAGDIDITVKNDLQMEGQSEISTSTEFNEGEERSTGDGGTIIIDTSGLVVLEDASIIASTSGAGDGGSIGITADTALFDAGGNSGALNEFTGVTTQAGRGSSGNAGDITLSIDDLTLRDDAQISSASFSDGDAGNISVESELITIENSNPDTEFATGFITSVEPLEGAEGTGNAGGIVIQADELNLVGDGAAVSSANDGTGAAGTIDIQLDDSLSLAAGADIFTDSASGGGGGITIKADDFIRATGPGTTISSTVADDSGNAGDIVIEAPVLALGDVQILAQADAGQGGDIQITVDDLLLSPTAEINAEAGDTGVDGTVAVSSPEVDITAGLVALDGRFLDVASLLRERCAAKRAEETSSFTLGTGGSIPTDLDAPRLSLLRTSSSEADADRKTVLVLPCPKVAS